MSGYYAREFLITNGLLADLLECLACDIECSNTRLNRYFTDEIFRELSALFMEPIFACLATKLRISLSRSALHQMNINSDKKMKKRQLNRALLLSFTVYMWSNGAMAYHPCDGGYVITDAVDGAIVGGVVGAVAGDAKSGAMIGSAAGVIDGAYADAECDQLIGEAVVEDAIISDYEDAVVEDAIVDAAIDDSW